MNFLKQLARLFTPSGPPRADDALWLTVECNRCHEQIKARIDMRNDPSPDYDGGEFASAYTCRKVVMGNGQNRCFQQIELLLTFNTKRQLTEKTITGGKFVEEV